MTSGNPWSAIASGVSSGLTFVIKICEYTYALRAVDQQTEDYLLTATHAWENVKICQRLLKQREDSLPADERRDYERVINEAKTAVEAVALLLEPARVDCDADGKIHMSTRLSWVLSDNANIAAALRRLDIVHTTLTQHISTLRLLRPYELPMPERVRSKEKPPSYHSSQLFEWKRRSRLPPMESIGSLSAPMFVQPMATGEIQDSMKQLPATNYLHRDGRGSTLESPMAHVSGPVEMWADTVAAVGPVPRRVESDDRTSSETSQSTSGSCPRARLWLEHQAMKSSTFLQAKKEPRND